MKPKFIFTVEHADYQTPIFLQASQPYDARDLRSHGGWDKGALAVAQSLSVHTSGTLFSYPYSRLYVDANRTIGPGALSRWCRGLDEKKQEKLLGLCRAYRKKIFQATERAVASGRPVYFFSVHSFTPVWRGQARKTDIGLLFRRNRSTEEPLALQLRQALKTHTSLQVHFNRPYRGHTDCLFNDVMDQFKGAQNLKGLFLELNQRMFVKHSPEKIGKILSSQLLNP